MKAMRFLIVMYLVIEAVSCAAAQPRYGINYEPMCWRTASGIDSSVVRYTLTPSQYQTPIALFYTDAAGDTINVSGGSLALCWCNTNAGNQPPEIYPLSGCSGSVCVDNPFNPCNPAQAKSVAYQGFVTQITSASQITVTLDGVNYTDFSFDAGTGTISVPTGYPANKIYYPIDGIAHVLVITATNSAGSTNISCSSQSN